MLRLSTAAASRPDVFPADGILKADRLARLKDAESIEKTARREAARCLRRAREEARAIRRKARETGHAEGLARFSEAIARVGEARTRLEGELDTLLRQALHGVLGRMPAEDWLSAVLDDVLHELHGEEEIVIMAHPASMRALSAALAALKRRNRDLVAIRPEPNPQMAGDDCLVYAGLDVIDVSLPVVVEEMIAALKAIPAGAGGENDDRSDDASTQAQV
ncbi:hypothetical protein HW532_17415 [Kaustia mangrovi]|uniref:Uncharacterized protein n=1 Tax=Kaustia mangrovi TaxID=2593653 RepID=A0A7S8C6J6_9HYPH|nr:HrpE/YscL family type III secretion apparatus protein [Kaustia mangrovi]QPC44320.1 hypothetical protein HW532_17415 [Kaustia mangrovi]